ncbi:uncharacterized protein BDR25DRAFT_345148 [Lindgomyces ingoldianus]|uniref:Uncharacterized protein n=1 Tax=Lindgomyces ingoldianus TaxID=673940 RepID=A0ACB6QJA9_9PLEO|nr:uncharacterized protein BDR25DRAFT_345148 [Lindgomyces ingoldianus]KAF2466952.1 hypothetical protein BDR25DRAFT_345148 [Lindgomyces ingoldianus]
MTPSHAPSQSPDPFDTLLTLEDDLYTTAHAAGVADGARAGRIEGRIFGLEKGFEKFASMGVLHGRACVWGARFHSVRSATEQEVENVSQVEVKEEGKKRAGAEVVREEGKRVQDFGAYGDVKEELPTLPTNPRLEKHVTTLHALTDPSTFSTENAEDAVADFDDRFKRASAKVKIIERMLGEADSAASVGTSTEQGGKVTVRRSVKISGEGKKDDSMEDFAGSRFLS